MLINFFFFVAEILFFVALPYNFWPSVGLTSKKKKKTSATTGGKAAKRCNNK
jgi:hypothetical protein